MPPVSTSRRRSLHAMLEHTHHAAKPPPPPPPSNAPPLAAAEDTADVAAGAVLRAAKALDPEALAVALVSLLDAAPYRIMSKRYPEAHGSRLTSAQLLLAESCALLRPPQLHVELAGAVPLRVDFCAWGADRTAAVSKSDGGTLGVWFVQVTPGVCAEAGGVLVLKRLNAEDFSRLAYLSALATEFSILTPDCRVIERGAEFDALRDSVKQLYLPLHSESWAAPGSPDTELFGGDSVVAMGLVPAEALPKVARSLEPADFGAMGTLLLYDLLVRNTDRFPCRRALPRPGASTNIRDQGNAGNVMIGRAPGEVWMVDPESVVAGLSAAARSSYVLAVAEIVDDVCNGRDLKWAALTDLWAQPVPVLRGTLDEALDTTHGWAALDEAGREAVSLVLGLIRFRASRPDAALRFAPPPAGEDEKEWRTWACQLPLAVHDVQAFVTAVTGQRSTAADAAAFRRGFSAAATTAVAMLDASRAGLDDYLESADGKNSGHSLRLIMDVVAAFRCNLPTTDAAERKRHEATRLSQVISRMGAGAEGLRKVSAEAKATEIAMRWRNRTLSRFRAASGD